MAEKKTLEQKIAEAEEKAKKERAKVAALKKQKRIKVQAAQLKVISELFPDMPEDEKELKKYFENVLSYAKKGVEFEERQKQQKQAQAAQHERR